jgi:hypothetical protein
LNLTLKPKLFIVWVGTNCTWATQRGSPPCAGLDWSKELGHEAGPRPRVLSHFPTGLPQRKNRRAHAQEERGRERLTCGARGGFEFFQKFSIVQNFNKFGNRKPLSPGLQKIYKFLWIFKGSNWTLFLVVSNSKSS